jgi:hypothetical protein
MNNENKCKTLLLFPKDVQTIYDAIIIAQNYYGDKRNGTLVWDATCQARIDEFERVFKSLVTTNWKELPEPTKEI